MLKRGHPPADWETPPERQKNPIDGVHNARRTHSVDQRAPFLTPRPESLQPQPLQPFQAIRRNAFINNDHVDT